MESFHLTGTVKSSVSKRQVISSMGCVGFSISRTSEAKAKAAHSSGRTNRAKHNKCIMLVMGKKLKINKIQKENSIFGWQNGFSKHFPFFLNKDIIISVISVFPTHTSSLCLWAYAYPYTTTPCTLSD